ncbi:MAG: murein biosynthesis integral membrane protein MurJ [Peptococcaceae bacterium]|nr:murein biosynthesis integral membrane protein MurJ [Peptococcaceae bacterium]
MSTSQKMFQAAGLIMAANLISRILGILRDSLLSNYAGLKLDTDAYMTAFAIPDFLYWILAGGMISAALIPVLSDYKDDSQREERWRIVNSVINISVGALIVVSVAAVVLAPQFIKLLVPFTEKISYDDLIYKRDLATNLTRLLMIQPVFMALSGIAMGVLNSKKIFWPSALGSLLYNAAIIVVAAILGKTMGVFAFVVGVIVGAIVNFVVQIPHMRKEGFSYRLIADWRHPAVRRIGIMSLPIFILQALNQFVVFTYTNMANSLGEGPNTAIHFSHRIHYMVVGIFAVAFVVASFPTLAEQAANREKTKFIETFSQAVRMVIFISIPASIGIILLRIPLISTLYEHGQFTADATNVVAVPLFFFAIGITFQGLAIIIPRAFYAMQDTWRPVLIGGFAMITSMGLMYLFTQSFPEDYKTGGLALAMSLGAILQTALLFFVLRRKIGPLDGRKIMTSTFQTAVASAVMAIGLFLWGYLTKLVLPATGELTGILKKLVSLTDLLGGACVGFLIFILIARAFRMEEFRLVMGVVRHQSTD